MQTLPEDTHKTSIDWYEEALALYNLERYTESIDHLSQSISINCNFSKAHHLLGVCYHKLEDYKKAVKHLNSSIFLNHNAAESYVALGNVFFDSKLPEKAIHSYTKAISINEKLASAYYGRARATEFNSMTAARQAIRDYTAALQLPNKYKYKAYNMRGIAFLFLGDYQAAQDDFSCALQINGCYAPAYENLARLLIKRGELMLQKLEGTKEKTYADLHPRKENCV